MYANGKVDSILINHLKYHIEYFLELEKYSSNLAVIGDALSLGYTGIPVALKRLALEDAYVFLNFNIQGIRDNPSLVYQELPGFKVYGRHCKSLEQWGYFNEIVSDYDLNTIAFQTLGKNQCFQNVGKSWIDPVAMRNYVIDEKQRLLKKEMI